MRDSREGVGRCVTGTEQAASLLGTVAAAIDSISAMNLRIATSTKSQSAISAQVNEDLKALQSVADDNAMEAGVLEGDSVQLNQATDRLVQPSKRFLVTRKGL